MANKSFKENFYGNIMPKIYGLGAAVVIVGALFKIMHWPFASLMLIIGLSVEAIIFLFSAFEPLHEDPKWELVYPELALGHDDFHKQFEALRGFNVKIIAEKVETWEDYQFCRLLGIEYFQGYFFEKPEMVTSKASKVNSMTLLQLMSSLLNTSVLSIDELERIVSQDAGLVHKLLRYLNSPITGLVASVDSVRLAIMLIGVEKLKSLTNLLLMSEMIGDRHVLLEQIMVRAKHAELFAHRRGYNNQDKYFLAGMLSMIDVCTGMKLGEVLGELPLPNEFINAIVHRSGRVGNTLDLVEHYGNGQAIKNSQDLDDLKKTYLDAIRWADEFLVMV